MALARSPREPPRATPGARRLARGLAIRVAEHRRDEGTVEHSAILGRDLRDQVTNVVIEHVSDPFTRGLDLRARQSVFSSPLAFFGLSLLLRFFSASSSSMSWSTSFASMYV